MRTTTQLCGLLMLAATMAIGCGHSKKTTIHRETVQTVPPATVVERRTTVETVPAPVVEQRTTTIRSDSVERSVETRD